MNKFFKLAVVGLIGSFSAFAGDAKSKSMDGWFAKEPAKRGAIPKMCRKASFSKKEVKAASKKVWASYKAGAIKLGWNTTVKAPVALSDLKKGVGLKAQKIVQGKETMPFVTATKGEVEKKGWPLFISLHGGGRSSKKVAPHGWDVNNREWRAQMTLFQYIYPSGFYFIPRMANDNDGRWWFDYCQKIYAKVIRRAILFRNIDPNRVYIMGISEGGYGTYRLAPFMADLFAGGNAMAAGGLTNNCPPENLINTAFRTDVGELDNGFKRQEYARAFHAKLDKLKKATSYGFDHNLSVQKGKGHGIDYSKGPAWLLTKVRNPFPRKLVWRVQNLHNQYRKTHFWLGYKNKPEKNSRFLFTAVYNTASNLIKLTAERRAPKEGKETLSRELTNNKIYIYLNDKMVDLDKPVKVILNGKEVFNKKVPRKLSNLMRTTAERGDPNFVFPGRISITLK